PATGAPATGAPASAATAPPAPAAGGVAACVLPLFPPESFDAATDFSFICSETDPIKGGASIRMQLVRAHHNVSEAMKEWALLGWYEMASFAVLQAHCCPSVAPLKLPEVHGCPSMPDALAAIASAAGATSDPADKALKKIVETYTNDIH